MTDPVGKIRLLMELRRQGIVDTRVLAAIERVDRERFIPPHFRNHAYDNVALPIEQGQTISQPYIVAFMTQALMLGARTKVLEIGTGSGYQAAILAGLCRRVYTIERFSSLLKVAEKRFLELKITNITAKTGDGYKGWPEQAPFERIIVTAAAPEIPGALCDQLAIGGHMIIPVGNSSQDIVKLTRQDEGFAEDILLPVQFVPMLPGIAREA